MELGCYKEGLKRLGLSLPKVQPPAFEYLPVVLHNNLAYVSGQLPWDKDFESVLKGVLGGGLSVEDGQEAARRCVLAGLGFLEAALGNFERLDRVIKISGFVTSAPGFHQQPLVIDAASNLLVDLFGEKGRHARIAVGVHELPRGSAVEIEFVFGLTDH